MILQKKTRELVNRRKGGSGVEDRLALCRRLLGVMLKEELPPRTKMKKKLQKTEEES